jgi:hypothetical protein
MDIASMVGQMTRDGSVRRIVRNRAAQFGPPTAPLLGATILPARDVPENAYTDDQVRYRSFVANDATRYSPPALKKGVLVGSVDVKLLEADIGSEMTAQDLDAVIRYLERNMTMQAVASITNFLDSTVNRPLEQLREKHRWEAIENAQIVRVGISGYAETISLSNPTGHRASAAGAWSNNANDPMADVFNRRALLTSKGFRVNRIVTTLSVMNIMSLNAIMRSRAGTISLNVGGGLAVNSGAATFDQIGAIFAANGLPRPEMYDEVYHDQLGTKRYISDDVMIFVGTTGRSESVNVGTDAEITLELLPNVLGYYGVGRAAGQSDSGRVALSRFFEDKPPRIETQGWETSAPVILEPEAIATITGIA